MRVYIRRLLLGGTTAGLSFLLLFYLVQRQIQKPLQYPNEKKQILAVEAQKESPGLPVRLKIPGIGVDAPVEYVGLTSGGAMDVPKNILDVGWFISGSRPGEKGSAVIAGHLNGQNGEVGVFANLDKIRVGDKLYVEDDQGRTNSFVVRESRMYVPGYADDVFSSSDGAHLNLITCDGVWDGVKKSYSKRLVVFADIVR